MAQSGLMWDSSSSGTKKSYAGQKGLRRDRAILCGTEQSCVAQSSVMWERAVQCGTKQSHVGQCYLVWDREISYVTAQSDVGQCSLLWNRRVLCGWGKSCQKVKNNFPKVWQILNCLASLKIFFCEFYKSPGLPEGSK